MPLDKRALFRDCPWCGVRDAEFRSLSEGLPAARPAEQTRYWSFIACPRCGGFVALETKSPRSAAPVQPIAEYPQVGAEVQVRDLPEDVAGYYRDALRVLEAGVPDAAAVQLRRTLEAATAHSGIASGPLVQRIEKLIEQGHITTDFGRVLDHVRKIGNVGAHATDERIDEETARRALRFTTLFLRNLFEIPAELRALDDAAPE